MPRIFLNIDSHLESEKYKLLIFDCLVIVLFFFKKKTNFQFISNAYAEDVDTQWIAAGLF